MTFHFTPGGSKPDLVNMALETRFSDGTVIQVLEGNVNGRRAMLYRDGTTGKWKDTAGISFGDLQRIPGNLAKAIGKRDPVSEVFVMPAI